MRARCSRLTVACLAASASAFRTTMMCLTMSKASCRSVLRLAVGLTKSSSPSAFSCRFRSLAMSFRLAPRAEVSGRSHRSSTDRGPLGLSKRSFSRTACSNMTCPLLEGDTNGARKCALNSDQHGIALGRAKPDSTQLTVRFFGLQLGADHLQYFPVLIQLLVQELIEEAPGPLFVHAAFQHEEVVLVAHGPLVPMVGRQHDRPDPPERLGGQPPYRLAGLRGRQGLDDFKALGPTVLYLGDLNKLPRDHGLVVGHAVGLAVELQLHFKPTVLGLAAAELVNLQRVEDFPHGLSAGIDDVFSWVVPMAVRPIGIQVQHPAIGRRPTPVGVVDMVETAKTRANRIAPAVAAGLIHVEVQVVPVVPRQSAAEIPGHAAASPLDPFLDAVSDLPGIGPSEVVQIGSGYV